MKILVTANQKGGVGKSSLVVNLAFFLARIGIKENGEKTLVIDTDTQANSSFTLSKHGYSVGCASDLFLNKDMIVTDTDEVLSVITADPKLLNVEQTSLAIAIDNLRFNLKKIADKGYKYCIIDTAPALSVRLSALLAVADYVVSPIELEAYSLQGLKLMLTTINNIRQNFNKKLEFIGMLPSRVDTRNPRHKRHLEELNKVYSKSLVPHVLSLRSSIADALALKVPIWSIKKTSARPAIKEVLELSLYIKNKMEQ